MSAPIPRDVLTVQHHASDPSVSAWVSANAGSGKTHVLAQRVIRLLLDGTDPGKILCLTFTKAAAANMANRVFTTLARWITLEDAELDNAIRQVGVARSDAATRAAARRLFASALETPGGLKIQTIHAFCARLLQQFPFEAHVAARFRVLEEVQQRELLERVRLSVLLEASAEPESTLGRALAGATTAASDLAFKIALDEAIRERDHVMDLVERALGIAGVRAQLSHLLDIAAADTLEQIEREIVESPLLPASEWTAVADIMATGSSQIQKRAEQLREAAALSGAARLRAYLSVFLTDGGTARNAIMTMALARDYPELARRLEEEKHRVVGLCVRRRAATVRDRRHRCAWNAGALDFCCRRREAIDIFISGGRTGSLRHHASPLRERPSGCRASVLAG
jgi:ATP-dependent helicase/nuclease subunit A